MEGQMTNEHFDEKYCSKLTRQEPFVTVCKQEVLIINDINVEKEELEFSEEVNDEISKIKELDNEEITYDWNEPYSSMELKCRSLPQLESTCREETTLKYPYSTSSAVNVVVTRGGDKLVEVKEEYSDTEVRTGELLNVENHFLGDITEENILINYIKVENEEFELDEVNTADSDVEKEEEMCFDWNEPVTVGPDPLALYPVVQSNIKTECINEDGTAVTIEASSSIQKGNDMVQCDQDMSSGFTMSTQDKCQRIMCSQINLISDCRNFKDINVSLHEKSFNSNNIYKCSQCSYTVVGSSCKLKDHMRVHSLEKRFKCLQCDYSSKRSAGLKQHMSVHTSEKPFKCLQCNYCSARSADLKQHMSVHTSEKPFKCLQCNYSCARSTGLKQHMRIHNCEKPFKCSQCDYSSTKSVGLKQHMSVHTGERLYKCLQCDYSASSSSTLKTHTSIHSGVRPYKCPQCDYSAALSSGLKRHVKIHSGEKPHKCPQCDYSTAYITSLNMHIKIHSGVRPYKCSQCDYSAAHSPGLKRHVKIHSGVKPYKCPQCDYSAALLCTLKKHLMVHSDEKPYICGQCNYSATCSGNLKRHLRIHSQDNDT